MKIAFPQILALIACVLLTACGAGNNCVGHNGCSDSAATTTTTTSSSTATTYTIGGTISGLTSSSLVLQNNSGNALTVSANSSTFVFTTALASGATYSVTVGTQPTGLTCTVTSGTGTIASANVANVVVACTTSGVVSTLAGNSSVTDGGYADGTGTAALFNGPNGMAVDSSGNVYVADSYNLRIRKITAAGVVTTFAGSGTKTPFTNGTGTAATLARPIGITIDSSGNLFVIEEDQSYLVGAATQFGSTVRKITPAGVVTTFAGSSTNQGSSDGTGTAALFTQLAGIAIDSSDNLYVTDRNTCTIRKITPAAVVTTFAGTNGTCSSLDGTGTAARFNRPNAITIDSSGNLYVIDFAGEKIRKITSAGVVTTFAGTGAQANPYTNGTGTAASFSAATGITADSSGNLYVTEFDRQTIRKITSAGVVTTYAGLEDTVGTTDGTLTNARFNRPINITTDSSGNLYVSDWTFGGNNNIRKIVR